jgi:ribosomal-protein-alanine N-acetyltransferase
MKSIQSPSGEISLRQPVLKDRRKIAKLADNKKIFDNVRDFFPYPYTEKNAEEFITLCRHENPKLTFAIDCQGELAGVIGLVTQPDIYRLTAEIGYWVGEPFWNRGIASNALKLMVDYGFKTLGLVRIYTGVFDYNKASQRVLEKCGFTLEGIFKKSILKNGIICDEYRYAIVKNN